MPWLNRKLSKIQRLPSFFERIGELAAGWLMSIYYFFGADILILADYAAIKQIFLMDSNKRGFECDGAGWICRRAAGRDSRAKNQVPWR